MHEELDGPDFLEAMADKANGQGLDVDASEYRRRSHQWRELKRDHEQARADIVALQERVDRIAHLTRAA